MLTSEASRAARGLLRWSMRDLEVRAGVSLPTLLKLENGRPVSPEVAARVAAAFEAAGVSLLNDSKPGARVVDRAAFDAALLPGNRKRT